MKRTVSALAFLLVACSSRSPWIPANPANPANPASPTTPSPRPNPPARADAGGAAVGAAAAGAGSSRAIRVALAGESLRFGATSSFAWAGGPQPARSARGDEWRAEAANGQVTLRSSGGVVLGPQPSFVLRPDAGGFAVVNGKRYRGELAVAAADAGGGVIVVNRLPLEDYLRSVVAVEMGKRPRGDSAALQAQAVASRTFAFVRLATRSSHDFDVRASVLDQAYGGIDVENEEANAAVLATRGLVVQYQGRVVDTPYSSTCGGSTAEPTEVWRTSGAPHLQRVSDRIGGTSHYYCDIAPRFSWTREHTKPQLDAALQAYLKAYASVPEGGPGGARHLAAVNTTASGRVSELEIETDRAAYTLRGNDIRYVLRTSGGEILPSTYFSVEPAYGRDGVLTRVTFRGRGNGHGVGMCQWGAIGRARAGQSFRTILATYYPGTSVGLHPVQ
ncbi:MAG: SpoIID/LytB domain-containing protein [Gemmatimonadaceae bacterium]